MTRRATVLLVATFGLVAIGCTGNTQDSENAAAITASTSGEITAAIDGWCITVNSGIVQLDPCTASAAQRWAYTNRALVLNGGQCLTIPNDRQVAGQTVFMGACNGTAEQEWVIEGTQIQTTTGLCLNVRSTPTAQGSELDIDTCNGTSAQSFSVPVSVSDAACPTGEINYEGACYASTRTCTVANGTGTQPFVNGAYAACIPVTCPAGFMLSPTGCVVEGSAHVVTACEQITEPGNYQLLEDIAAAPSAPTCLNIHDVSGVNLDCGGHTITTSSDYGTDNVGITMTNVKNVSVAHCNLVSPKGTQAPWLLDLTSVQTASFVANTFGETTSNIDYQTYVDSSSRLTFVSNTMTMAYQQDDTSYSTMVANSVTSPVYIAPATVAGGLISNAGNHNVFVANTIDGRGSPGNCSTGTTCAGADDGIVLGEGESYGYIAANSISHVWDLGVEWTYTLSNSVITNNQVTLAEVGGFGAYGQYFAGLSDSTLSFNTVTRSGTLFDISPPSALGGGQTKVLFTNNRFEGNVVSNSLAPNPAFPTSFEAPMMLQIFDTPSSAPTLPAQLTNNIFVNNNFGTWADPDFYDTTGSLQAGDVIDGGGNVCLPNPYFPPPIKCY